MTMTLDQERAAFAWRHTETRDENFKEAAVAAPALVMQNGLMQALAYYQAKERYQLVDAVLERLATKVLRLDGEATFDKVMRALHTSDSDIYMRATEEALETLRWLRQFAKTRDE
jgi:CRISPR-associated protein Cmr5